MERPTTQKLLLEYVCEGYIIVLVMYFCIIITPTKIYYFAVFVSQNLGEAYLGSTGPNFLKKLQLDCQQDCGFL